MKLYIKYMVSMRCKLLVAEELQKLNIPYTAIDLGIADISGVIPPYELAILKSNLLKSGLELMDDKKSILIEKVKNLIIQMVHYSDDLPRVNHSDYISDKLGYDYTYLANIFSEVEGITIQQFIIIHKIERVKELIFYNELTLTEISHKLHYSSVAYLSNQFKQVTGLSPSFYRQSKSNKRDNLENV